MTRKTNFFHSHRGVVARPLHRVSNQPADPSVPDPAPEAVAAPPAPRRWWSFLAEPRWPGARARDAVR